MSSYPPPFPTYPILTPDTFNNDFFTNTEEGLSLDNAFKYFLRLTGGTISGNLNVLLDFNAFGNTYLNTLYIDNILVNSTATELNYNNGITLGVGTANKVLTLNSTGDVSGINLFEADEITANNGLTVQGGHLTMSASSHIKINSTSDYTNTTDASIYSKGGIYIEKSFQALQNVISDGLLTNSITLNGTAITATATQINYLSGITLGTISPSKVITVDASSYINSTLQLNKSVNASHISFQNGTSTGLIYHFRNSDIYFGTTSANGVVFQTNNSPRVSINSAGLMNIQAGWSISGTSVSATADELNYNDITTIGTAQASKSMVLDASKQIKEITKLQIGTNTTLGSRDFMILNSSANAGFRVGSNETTGNCLTFQWTYVGSNNANNKFSIDFFGVSNQFAMLNSGNVGIGTGTPAYKLDVNGSTNITSLYLNGTQITASATELNYLDFSGSYVLGVCEASKAVVLDSSRNVSNINQLTCDYLVVNTAINSSNASASFKKINLNNLANNFGTISVQGGAGQTSPFFASTDSILYSESNNLNPICFELNVSNLTSATSTNALRLGTTTANDFNLFTNQVERINIASAGDVKILSTSQTSSPTTGAFLVEGGIGCNKAIWANNNISTYGRLRTLNDGIGLEHTDGTIGLITYADAGGLILNEGAYFGTNTNHPLMFQTNELERMRINAGGNISIGNTNNTYKLDVSGDINCSGSVRVAGTALPSTGDLEKIAGIVNGEASANKALVLDADRDIQLINWIQCNSIECWDDITITSGDLYVKEQAITNIGGNIYADDNIKALAGNIYAEQNLLGDGGNIYADDTIYTPNLRIETGGRIFGNKTDIFAGVPFKFGTLSNDDFLLMANDNQSGLYIKTNGRIGIRENNPDYELEVDGDIGLTGSLFIGGTEITASATELNYVDTTAGSAQASKALILDTNKDITGIRKIGMTGNDDFLTLTNSTATGRTTIKFTGDTTTWEVGTRNSTNASNPNNFYIYGNAGYRFLIDTSGNVDIVNHNGATTGLKLNGTLITASASELNYVDTTAGTAEASKALILNSSRNISNINAMSLTGLLSNAFANNTTTNVNYQTWTNDLTTDIVSVLQMNNVGMDFGTTSNHPIGFITNNTEKMLINAGGNVSIGNTNNTYKLDITGDCNISGDFRVNGSIIDVSAITGVSAGTATASKALIVDANRDITNIRRISTANISLNNATTYPTVLHCGSTAGDKIIGVFNNTSTFYGFGASDSQLKLQTGGSAGFGFYTTSTGSALGDLQVQITSTSTTISATTSSTGATSGALIVSGGAGIAGNIYSNGVIVSNNGQVSSSTSSGAVRSAGGLGVAGSGYFGHLVATGQSARTGLTAWATSGIQFRTGAVSYTTSSTGTLASNVFNSFAQPTLAGATAGTITTEASTVYIDNAPLAGTNMTITNAYALWINAGRTILKDTTASTNSTSGALVVSGGIGVGGDIRLGSGSRVWLNTNYGFTQTYTTGGTAEMYSYTNGVDLNYFGTYTNNDFSIATNNTARMTFSKSGAISTSNPITFTGNNDIITLTNSTASGRTTIKFDGDARDYELGTRNSASSFPNGFYLWDNTNSAYRLVITSDPKLLYNTNSSYSNAKCTFNGSGAFIGSADWLDGTYQVVMSLRTSDSANEIQAQIKSGDTAYWGTKSNTKFALMANNTECLCCDTNQRVGIGTAVPTAKLHVSGSVSTTIAITGVYGEYGSATYANNQLGPITRDISIRASSGVLTSTSFFAQSDRRHKKNIVDLEEDEAMNFVETIKPIKYNLKNEEDTATKHYGYIAQDLKQYVDLLNFSERENFPKEQDDDIENISLSVDYSKVCVLLHKGLKNALDRIKKLEDFISTLDIEEV
jgi:hypothetical protein